MRTKRDVELADEGLVSFDRLRALQHALTARAVDARNASRIPGTHPNAISALHGKAKAYQEAADQIETLLHGNGLRKPKWSTARAKDRIYRAHRSAGWVAAHNQEDSNG